ncbi:hypothetical protein [Shewanella sp. Isolate11]|uniref:hypothetical protein n=1 Tax=Shewanella sp. Isolate11 TaxID=2908530 RepID=UPI001EFE578B|nr:hypothetical protein [Shewanella sp. Isolate11]MCG9698118.1 hypothetical protein [Shewanella sp. Isolate11]
MKSIIITLVILLILSAITYFSLNKDQVPDQAQKQILLTNTETRLTDTEKQTDITPSSEVQIAQAKSSNDDQTAQSLSTENISAKQLVAKIIDAQEVVDGEQIKKLLSEDLEAYVELIESLDNYDTISQQRLTALADRLAHLPEAIYSEKYACADRICALSLTTDTISQQSIDKLSEFDKNYAFIKQTQLDSGETQFQAIYLQTDDPSTMRFKGY